MDLYETVWLFAEDYDQNGSHCFYTVDGLAPGTTVWATVALSYIQCATTTVNDALVTGAGGALIRGWETFNPDGTVTSHSNFDYAGNAELIENCASVTFELSLSFARMWAQGNVFIV
jgi:hypothetical protein